MKNVRTKVENEIINTLIGHIESVCGEVRAPSNILDRLVAGYPNDSYLGIMEMREIAVTMTYVFPALFRDSDGVNDENSG